MENWNPTLVFEVGYAQHTERVARGEVGQRESELRGGRPRARLAGFLIALAARLDPARSPSLAPSIPTWS